MKKGTLILTGWFSITAAFSQTATGVIKEAHRRYYQAPCKTYTFSQKNTHYKADTVSGHSEWYEAIEFPDKFRIDFGDPSLGNAILFRNDSLFSYRKHELVKARADSASLLLLLGGMYYRELEDVLARIKQAGYDLDIMSLQTWNGADTYVIGAKEKDLTSNQVWLDKKTLRVMRILERSGAAGVTDIRFEAHQDWCRGYVETRVSFRRNGELEQVEEYYNIRPAGHFPGN